MIAEPNTDVTDTPADAPAHGNVPADGGVASGPTNPPPPASNEAVGAATDLKQVVTQENGTAGSIVETLDSYAIELGDTHVSIWSALVVLLVIIGVWFFARFGSRLAHKALAKLTALDSTQQLLSEKLITVVMWAFAILVGIDMLGIDLTALAVFSGAFGLAIGFGLQKTLGNLIAGIILLMDRSIKPGDVITVADASGNESFGQIRKIGIRAISVVTRDKTEYLIPNENLMINQVVNWSYSSKDVRVKAPIGVAYGSDLELVAKLLMQAAHETPRILKSPLPRVNIMGFGESSVDFEIRFWIQDPEEGLSNIRSDVYQRIWQLFKQHEIEIPFPQRDLYLKNNEQFERLIAAMAQRTGKQA